MTKLEKFFTIFVIVVSLTFIPLALVNTVHNEPKNFWFMVALAMLSHFVPFMAGMIFERYFRRKGK